VFFALSPTYAVDFLFENSWASFIVLSAEFLCVTGDVRYISAYLSQIFFHNEILYENNILVSINVTEKPCGVTTEFINDIAPVLHLFKISCGYMEVVDMAALLQERGIDKKTIFYGIETNVSDKLI
jgi:KUP system potassium uptake protein